MLSTVSEYFQGLAAFTTIYINSPLSDGRANANRRSCTGQDVLMLKWTFCFHSLSTFCGYRKKKIDFDVVVFVFEPILSGSLWDHCETNNFMSCQVVADVKGDTTWGGGYYVTWSRRASLFDDFAVGRDSICTHSVQLSALDTRKQR